MHIEPRNYRQRASSFSSSFFSTILGSFVWKIAYVRLVRMVGRISCIGNQRNTSSCPVLIPHFSFWTLMRNSRITGFHIDVAIVWLFLSIFLLQRLPSSHVSSLSSITFLPASFTRLMSFSLPYINVCFRYCAFHWSVSVCCVKGCITVWMVCEPKVFTLPAAVSSSYQDDARSIIVRYLRYRDFRTLPF